MNILVSLKDVSRPRPLTKEVLESFACHCAYRLMGTQQIDRAAHVIRNIHGEEALRWLLNDVLMTTMDTNVRSNLTEYLRRHHLMNNENDMALGNQRKMTRLDFNLTRCLQLE